MSHATKWQRVSEEIGPLLENRKHRRAWNAIETALRVDPHGAEEEEFEFLARATQVVTLFGEYSRAVSWIELHRTLRQGKGPPDRRTSAAYDAVRLLVELSAKNFAQAEQLVQRMDWSAVPGAPWVFIARIYLATYHRRGQEVIGLLRRPSPLFPDAPGTLLPSDRSSLLSLLGNYYLTQGRWERARGYFRATLRECARDSGIDSRLREIYVRGRCGVAASNDGHLAEAEDSLRLAIEGAKKFGHPVLQRSFELELASLYQKREEFVRAEKLFLAVARSVRRRTARTGADHSHELHALLRAAGNAIDAGATSKAERYLRRSELLLARQEHCRLRGIFHSVRGRLLSTRRPHGWRRRAFQEFDAAERCFRAQGGVCVLELARLNLYRGEAHLRLRNVKEALRDVGRVWSLDRSKLPAAVQEGCVLLKSQALLTNDAPRPDQLYEDVLGNLGLARNPVTLFKIVANLYLYTWELDQSHLDLTDYHLRQVNKMGEILDRQTFERLYTEHVTRKVVRRAFERTFRVGSSYS